MRVSSSKQFVDPLLIYPISNCKVPKQLPMFSHVMLLFPHCSTYKLDLNQKIYSQETHERFTKLNTRKISCSFADILIFRTTIKRIISNSPSPLTVAIRQPHHLTYSTICMRFYLGSLLSPFMIQPGLIKTYGESENLTICNA